MGGLERIKAWGASPWVSLVSLVTGVLGLLLGVYFYLASVAEREPRYLIDPARVTLLDPSRLADSPIRILRSDAEGGGEITRSLTSVRFYFWNEGKVAIKRENVLEQVQLRLSGDGNRLIDARIVNEPRSVVRASVKRASVDRERKIEIDFERLEQGDGITVQVLWEGDPKAGLVVGGLIEGPAPIHAATVNLASKLWSKAVGPIGILVVRVLVLFGIGPGLTWADARLEKAREEKRWQRPFMLLKLLAKLALTLFVLAVLAAAFVPSVIELITPGRETVPRQLLPASEPAGGTK